VTAPRVRDFYISFLGEFFFLQLATAGIRKEFQNVIPVKDALITVFEI